MDETQPTLINTGTDANGRLVANLVFKGLTQIEPLYSYEGDLHFYDLTARRKWNPNPTPEQQILYRKYVLSLQD
jgi:hypothetical protein